MLFKTKTIIFQKGLAEGERRIKESLFCVWIGMEKYFFCEIDCYVDCGINRENSMFRKGKIVDLVKTSNDDILVGNFRVY